VKKCREMEINIELGLRVVAAQVELMEYSLYLHRLRSCCGNLFWGCMLQ